MMSDKRTYWFQPVLKTDFPEIHIDKASFAFRRDNEN